MSGPKMTKRPPLDPQAEAMAVRALAAELAGEDLELAVASETNLVEAIEATLDAMRDAETMRDAIGERIRALRERSDRLDQRADRLRDVILGAMATAGLKTLPLPEATLTAKDGAAKPAVIDEALLPERFWVERVSRSPDYRAIGAALKLGEPVPGATLSNAAPTLQVRTK